MIGKLEIILIPNINVLTLTYQIMQERTDPRNIANPRHENRTP